MFSRRLMCISLAALLLASLPGCNSWNGDEEEPFDQDLLELGASTNTSPDTVTGQSGGTDLKLSPGKRFALLKTVEQSLSQLSPQGLTSSRSSLDVLLTLSVEEVREGRTRLGVHYDRVRFRQDMGGQSVEYDSSNPPYPVPMEAQAYHGMVNNLGFSFWLGLDNRVVELVGFEGFLSQCLRDTPYDARTRALSNLTDMPPEQRLADFLDESIGLLPFPAGENARDAPARTGDNWKTKRIVTQPVPMYVTTQYTLVEMNDREATIDVLGTIDPPASNPVDQPAINRVRVTVRGGQCHGNCTIDRQTGLPIRSRVERFIDMQVQTTGNIQFQQRQHTVTAIRSLAEQQSLAAVPTSSGGNAYFGGDGSAEGGTQPRVSQSRSLGAER